MSVSGAAVQPRGVTIVGRRGISGRSVDDHDALRRRFGIDFHRAFPRFVVSLIGAFGRDAGEACQPLCASEGLDVLVQNLIGRRRVGRLLENFIRVIRS